jgi:4-diphosphocytidyl-2-C-methyl-D-erythritol kinase
MVLVHPGLHVPTPSVFKALAAVGYPSVSPCPSSPEGERPPWRNDLTDASIHVCPELAFVRQALMESGGEPLLCGSGSCWVARYKDLSQRDLAYQELQAQRPEWRFWKI